MGLLSTLAKHRAEEMEALHLKDRITKLNKDDVKDPISERRREKEIDKLSDQYEKKMNHSKIPMKVADDIHKIRKFHKAKKDAKNSVSKEESK